jgi:hypothetical protein
MSILSTVIDKVEAFAAHLPGDVATDFANVVSELRSTAQTVADDAVKAAGVVISADVPVIGPMLAPLFTTWADGLIAELTAAKAKIAG